MLEFLRYARIVSAIYVVIMSILLYRKRKHGIDIIIGTYGVGILFFYVEYFLLDAPPKVLNEWSALLGLHALLIFAFYNTEKLVLLRGIEKAHRNAGSNQKE